MHHYDYLSLFEFCYLEEQLPGTDKLRKQKDHQNYA